MAEAEPGAEEAGAAAAEEGGDDLKLAGKKKKKKAVAFDDGEAGEAGGEAGAEEEEAAGDGGPSAGLPWAGTTRDYLYEELLGRVFGILRENNPELAGEKHKTILKPPQARLSATTPAPAYPLSLQVLREGTKKTVFVNFSELCKAMHRRRGTRAGARFPMRSTVAHPCTHPLLSLFVCAAPST